MKVDYGEAFDEMFFVKKSTSSATDTDGTEVVQMIRESRGRTIMASPTGEDGPSWDRMKRKMMKKILLAHMASGTEEQVPFVWATGGHSAAAGGC